MDNECPVGDLFRRVDYLEVCDRRHMRALSRRVDRLGNELRALENSSLYFYFPTGHLICRAFHSEDNAVLGGISAAVPGWETCGGVHAVSVGLYGEGKETAHVCSGRRETE
jgi:hypothetical protein